DGLGAYRRRHDERHRPHAIDVTKSAHAGEWRRRRASRRRQAMRNSGRIRGVAAAFLAATAATAWAQDYSVSAVSGQWATPPASATNILPNFDSTVDSSYVVSGLPFAVSYFGRAYTSLSVSTNGFVQFGGGRAAASAYSAFPQSTTTDGVCAAAWGTLDA